jgi:hypothetical protein
MKKNLITWHKPTILTHKMTKCFSLGLRVSKSGKPCWKSTPSTVPYKVWYSPLHHKMRSGIGVIMCLILCTNLRYGQTSRLHDDRYETRYPRYLATEEQYLSRWGFSGVESVQVRQSFLKVHPIYGSV